MSPSEMDAARPMRPTENSVAPLLDGAFGFFVWAIHLLAIYIATALACVLGLGTAAASTRTGFLAMLGLVTLVAAAIVLLHAVRRYRQQRDIPDQRFRMSVTVGCDAIATVAIVWQLLAIGLV